MSYKEYSQIDLSKSASTILKRWEENDIFKKSISTRNEAEQFVFYEGPPSANGMPGIHHAMGRTIKDLFCRYQTLKGKQVLRKAGWDTHGLPVELGVEKELGITKEDIGTKISVEEYNDACRKAVMKYTDVWNELTRQLGYWVDMENPYVTYEPKYMESVWWLLKQLFDKNLIYKGYTIQPYSPKAGTGLSTHELNQPGSYRDVKDTTVVAIFQIEAASRSVAEKFVDQGFQLNENAGFIAWTTTPWTLPSNTALAVGSKVDYVFVNSRNRYTDQVMTVILAEALLNAHFTEGKDEFEIIGRCKGADLVGMRYEQLLPYTLPMESPEKAFQVIAGDFVTTEDGTGIVHLAPTFGADDARVAKEAGVPPMLIDDGNGNAVPLVDLQGRFVSAMGDLAGMYVKNEYFADDQVPDKSADVLIAIRLKEEGKAFQVEKYTHNYPHCWRTDKPILYYPLDSWFIKATDGRDRMVELNNTINWKPASTGTGRFGNWLENLNDWNLSRSRFWGIPIPIWSTEDGSERKCIGSIEELKNECSISVEAGLMSSNPFDKFNIGDFSKENYGQVDLHKHYVDELVLCSPSGQAMHRESDLIDVWFDSGSMPYAQWHYPFENKELIDSNKAFPADFIAEGVDQTRGWFYTLHAIASLCFDSVAFKNVVSNGLVLDKNGQKMSKRLGNAVDPFETLKEYGPDATRWYMITNAQPWDNLRFDTEGIQEVQRKFFGTLFNTYSFFGLYAKIDKFSFKENYIAINDRPEIDRWIISGLNSLIIQVDEAYSTFEPTKAGRLIQNFVVDQLSNWYVRLCRRRFWKGDYTNDKISAYQTLYECLETVAILGSPIAPFYMDQLFLDLNEVTNRMDYESVHLAKFPKPNHDAIDSDLEKRMDVAQRISSLVLGLRKKERIRVRQPLRKIMVPILNIEFKEHLEKVEELILSEVNVKELVYLDSDSNVLVKKIKPNFKTLGPRFGKQMKAISTLITELSQESISEIESKGKLLVELEGVETELLLADVEISSEDIPGWLVSSDGNLTVAMDISIDDELAAEGMAREFVNRIQNLRKDSGLEVTDKIRIDVKKEAEITSALERNLNYICAETLTVSMNFVDEIEEGVQIDLAEGVSTLVTLTKD